MKKSKYERRRAIDCELLEKSKTHKGYCKYLVTIAEERKCQRPCPGHQTDEVALWGDGTV